MLDSSLQLDKHTVIPRMNRIKIDFEIDFKKVSLYILTPSDLNNLLIKLDSVKQLLYRTNESKS